MSTKYLDVQDLKSERDRLWDRVRNLKTAKAREKAIKVAKEADRRLFDALYAARDMFGEFSITATVVDFQAGHDDFLVREANGDNLWICPSSDVLSKSWYPHTCCIEYVKGQTIVINCTVDVDFERACLRLIPGKVEGGKVNEAQYAELCKRNNLAFFKYPAGMSGLFAA